MGSATLEVHHKLGKYKIGRVQWKLYYQKEDTEHLLADGVDITQPGLITIYRPHALFDIGKYRLVLLDRRVMYNAPVKSELNWEINEPTSKLSNYG